MENHSTPSQEVAMAVAELEPVFLALVRSLIDKPEAATLMVRSNWLETVFEFSMDETDFGKVVGKQGRIARALRTLLSAASMKHSHHFTLNLIYDKQDVGPRLKDFASENF
jgi:predicted RNA-binding protein YlqC (UPF0109 family)